MRSPISLGELFGLLRSTGLDVPVLPEEDPRWQRLRLEPGQGVDLRDHFRGALIGGAIGDAMGRANEGVRPSEAQKRQIRDYLPWHGWRKDQLLSPGFCLVPGIWNEVPLAPKIAAVAAGSFKAKNPPAIRGTGYVVDCLEAALWAFHRSDSFKDGALLAVNLGDDADTTGAVFGQLAGACYGEQGIPEAWRSRLAYRELIERYAEQLCALARRA